MRSFLTVSGICGAVALMSAGAVAQPSYRAARNAIGQPDLEGVWTNATYTRLERQLYAPHVVLTPEEAAKAAARFIAGPPATAGVDVGQNESEGATNDFGATYARLRGEIRAGMIVDPVDGRLPYRPEALKTLGLDVPADPSAHRDNPEERTTTERCLSGEDSIPPALPSPDSNYIQIVQTRDAVAILSEKYHEVRIVRLRDRRHAHPAVTSWTGDEIGWWQGDTLVVETTNFAPASLVRYQRLRISPRAKVVERFTRTSPRELTYEVSVTDPELYTQTWRAELPFQASDARILEDACHEGNYSLPAVLAGARYEERRASKQGPAQ